MESRSTKTKSSHQSAKDETQNQIKKVAKTTSTKKRGRPPRAAKTTREMLYREDTTVTLPDSGIEVVFRTPGIPQKAAFLAFMTTAVLPMVMVEDDIKKLKKDELYQAIFQEFDKMLQEATPDQQAGIIAMVLMDYKGKQIMYELIIECFPGIDPTRVSDECYIEMFGILISDFNKSVLGVNE